MTTWIQPMVVFAAMFLAVGCVKRDSPPPAAEPAASAPTVPVVRSVQDARQHEGKRVRLTGPVFRAKLGDMVQAEGISAHCENPLPMGETTTPVTVEGKIFELDTSAKRMADGAWSQGTAPGTTSWMLDDCVLIE